MEETRIIRLLSKESYSEKHAEFVPHAILKLRDNLKEGLERGVSFFDEECAKKRSGSICKHITGVEKKFKRFEFFGGCAIWKISKSKLDEHGEYTCEENCHITFCINPKHEQNKKIFDDNNEALIKLTKKIFSMKNVYICKNGEEEEFRKEDYKSASTTEETPTDEQEKKISSFGKFLGH